MPPILFPSLDGKDAEGGDWVDGGDCGCVEELSSSLAAPFQVKITSFWIKCDFYLTNRFQTMITILSNLIKL